MHRDTEIPAQLVLIIIVLLGTILRFYGLGTETLWLDEVGAALDKAGVERFVEIVKEIQDEYGFKKVFNITQNVEMKRLIDKHILVTKTNDGSQVTLLH